jgi:hypothetical protein
MNEAINDLLFYFSDNGGNDGYFIRVASTKLDGAARAEELAAGLRPYLRDGATLTTAAEPSRFAPVRK